jgi:hypothetical protein
VSGPTRPEQTLFNDEHHGEGLLRFVTFNIASVDGRIGIVPSTPSWLDALWKPLDRFEAVDVLSHP